MPSSYTTSLRLTLPATGELAGQWGNTVNTGITELLDAAVAGTASISTWGGAGVAYTLSNNSGTADEARRMFIVATGTPGEAKNVICPAVSKFYVFRNDTTGGFDLTLKTSGGTGIAVPAGQYKFLYCDGTNVVEMFNSAGALTLSGALTVGGTATFAANPTLSAGTANQVQFLNASKVLSGSANLTFDGTDLTVSGAVNAGTVNATTLDLTNLEVTNIKAKDGTASMTLADATGVATFSANPVLSGGTANGVLYLNGSKVATSGTDLVFNATGLGIGTSSPGTKLHVTGSNGLFVQFLNSQNNTGAGVAFGSGTNLGRISTNGASTAMAFEINAVEKMQLDPAGNLGLGVTPSAWGSNYRALQVGYGGNITAGNGTFPSYVSLGANYYLDSTPTARYLQTAEASLYQQNGAQHQWFTAPSGTAGNAISFTQAMTLDASGYLLVGATSSAGVGISRLQVGSTSAATTQMLIQSASTHLGLYAASAAEAYVSYAVGSALIFGNGPANGSTFTERARITSGGDFGIGTTSPAYKLDVVSTAMRIASGTTGVGYVQYGNSATATNNWHVGAEGDGTYRFYNQNFGSGTERARITSGGDLLVGTTSVPTNGASGAGSASFNGPINFKGFRSHAGTSGAFAGNDFNLQWTGNPILWVDTTNVGQIATTSDYRIKENIAPIAHGAVDRVMQLNPIKFNRKDVGIFKGSDQVEEGFLAHELQAIIPSAVQGEKDALTEDGGIQPQSLTWAPLVSVLTKAIQEQQALITALTARVAALEAQP